MSYRPITPQELTAFRTTMMLSFGDSPPTEDVSENRRACIEFDRSLAAFEGTRIVGTAGIYSFKLTVPGERALPAGGITMVSVLPTHRRRGILRQMMQRLLRDMQERGEPLAILRAAESGIYGRFGFGMATDSLGLEIDRTHAAFARPYQPTGSFTLLDRAGAEETLPDIYAQALQGQPGAVSRHTAWWRYLLDTGTKPADGQSVMFHAIYTSPAGDREGYASYRIKSDWASGFPDGTLFLRESIAITPDAHAALWHYLLNVDLVSMVRTINSPIDEPLRWLLADSRRLRVRYLTDLLWLRILDVPAALAGRRYAATDKLVLQLSDTFMPENEGCYELQSSPTGAGCGRTTGAPDLQLDIAELGAAYLGGVRFTTLARAGRVVELTPGALARADRLFASEPAPWCITNF